MLPAFSNLPELVATTKLWVLPTNTPFFELDYPQKSPQCFAIKKPASNPTQEEARLRTVLRDAEHQWRLRLIHQSPRFSRPITPDSACMLSGFSLLQLAAVRRCGQNISLPLYASKQICEC
jgi:hypothetical protein